MTQPRDDTTPTGLSRRTFGILTGTATAAAVVAEVLPAKPAVGGRSGRHHPAQARLRDARAARQGPAHADLEVLQHDTGLLGLARSVHQGQQRQVQLPGRVLRPGRRHGATTRRRGRLPTEERQPERRLAGPGAVDAKCRRAADSRADRRAEPARIRHFRFRARAVRHASAHAGHRDAAQMDQFRAQRVGECCSAVRRWAGSADPDRHDRTAAALVAADLDRDADRPDHLAAGDHQRWAAAAAWSRPHRVRQRDRSGDPQRLDGVVAHQARRHGAQDHRAVRDRRGRRERPRAADDPRALGAGPGLRRRRVQKCL